MTEEELAARYVSAGEQVARLQALITESSLADVVRNTAHRELVDEANLVPRLVTIETRVNMVLGAIATLTAAVFALVVAVVGPMILARLS